jgi:hypothetical protein
MARAKTGNGANEAETTLAVDIEEKPAYEVKLEYLSEAPVVERPTSSKPRHRPPPVLQGALVQDDNPSPAISFDSPQMFGDMLLGQVDPNELVIERQQDITTLSGRNMSSQINEPSAAMNGNLVFYTGNWYASISTDGGATFRFVDPFNQLQNPPGLTFCCDQVVHYIPQIDTFVWLLQYSNTANSSGPNIQRLAFATTANAALGTWRLFDVTPDSLGQPGVFMDFPDLAVGANMLYMTTNMFVGQNWRGTALVRIPLAGIVSGSFSANAVTSNIRSGFRVAQHCGTRAFFGAHLDSSTLRIFSWDEDSNSPDSTDIDNIPTWNGAQPYASITPDSRRWLNRADGRLLGATMARINDVNELWFAWGSNRGGVNQRRHPFIQIARINSANFQLIESINLHHDNFAFACPSLTTNAKGEVAASYFIGGGGTSGKFPTHAVSILTGVRKDVTVLESLFGPFRAQNQNRNGFGDYLTLRRHHPNVNLFTSTGYTLQSDPQQSERDATPHFIIFGRAADIV